MKTFFCPRGTISTFRGYGNSPTPYVQLKGLNNAANGILLIGVSGGDSDIIIPTATLDNQNVFYVFGRAAGDFTISGVCFLGGSNQNMRSVETLRDFFTRERVSNSKKAVTLTLSNGGGGMGYYVFLHSLIFGEIDNEFNMQRFSIGCTVAKSP